MGGVPSRGQLENSGGNVTKLGLGDCFFDFAQTPDGAIMYEL